jgi:acyl-[acyl-carrier-protein]-phospholipid O-acyltransferase/long-chain-fatty-acid--[acyl-carrier-protein] ligase
LVSEHADADRSGLLQCARQQELGELTVPRKIIAVAKLPVLGSGKTDYVAITALAKQELGLE